MRKYYSILVFQRSNSLGFRIGSLAAETTCRLRDSIETENRLLCKEKDAKTLIEAIEKRFGGNKETKKVQKTLLKKQYKNFIGSSSESQDQIHDRL
nr:hypothetical protein [Tanacetum cinerariifolium]